MSSILKALQRLQGDRGAAGSPAPKPALQDQLVRDLAAPPLVPPAQAPAEEEPVPSRARLALVAIPAAIALLSVASVGWWLASRGSDEEATTPAPVAAAPQPASEPAPPPVAATRPAPPPVARTAPAAPPPEADTAALAVDPDPDRNRVRRTAPLQRRPTGEAPRYEVVAEAKPEEDAAPAPPPPSEDPERRPGAMPPKSATPRAGAPGTVRPADPSPREARPASAAKPKAPAPAPKPAAKPASAPASDGVAVLRTVWHPKPDRRTARLRLPGMDEPVLVREGDSVRSYLVKAIEPSGVVLVHGGRELRHSVGSGAAD